ncbi:MAG: TonB-dependent receptor [Bacteroidales bacterium]|nr:TonB-dependent receptor [Bacteroidales bacterium]MDD4029873.1 TonB-dependent receptor [Bacteroidales bacterium]MDD4434953.1 TonB-dependent receptor [Bacteroidales bacterium]
MRKIALPFAAALLTAALFPVAAYGQEQKDTMPVPLGEIVVTSLRIDRQIRNLPTSMVVVDSSLYQKRSALTIANVLEEEPGVSRGGDGVWSTNINIRGFNEDRLVILIDGNRVETATDLTASLSMVDVNDVERVEVIKGAQSSLYGTGAIGGIVNIISKQGYFGRKPYVSSEVISGYTSVNRMFSNHASVSAGSRKWYLNLGGTYAKAGNLRTPDGILPNSQFNTSNISAKLGVRPLANHLFKIQYQRNWSWDVGVPGGDAFPGPAKATYTDIGRHLLSASYRISNITEKWTTLELKYFTQYIAREVMMEPNTVTQASLPNGNVQRTTPEVFYPTGYHLTNGVQLQGTWELSDKNTLIAGVDVWSRKLRTGRDKYIRIDILNPAGTIIKTNNVVRGETPIPESSFSSAGLFFQNETRFMDNRLTMILGGRFDGIRIKNQEGYDVDYIIMNGERNDNPPSQRITFEKGTEYNISWSANAGFLYKLSGSTDLSLNLARAFRAPSLEERFKYIDLGNFVRLGDPALKPEKSYSADLGVRVWKSKFNLQAGVFINRMNNMIVEMPGEFIFRLTADSKADTIPALVNANVRNALLYGADFKFAFNFSRNFVFFGTGAYVRGVALEADANLPLIPPLNGRAGLRYTWQAAGSAELSVFGAARQDKIAEGEQETAGYYRLDFALNTKAFDLGFMKIQGFAGIDNITNNRYTNHLSTNRGDISVEPGRNVYLRLKLSF